MASRRTLDAGKATITLSLQDKVSQGLRAFQGKLSKISTGFTSIGTRMASVGAAIGGAFVYPIKAASALEEVLNKFNVVFGENAGEVKAWSDNFAKEVGRSQKQVAEFMGNTQDLFIPLGFEPGAATELSKTITGLAIDLASFNDGLDEDALRDLHAALTGSGEVMKKYGVIVSEAAVKQELLNQGLDPTKATEQAKVQARLAIIMRGTTAAQGDAIRSAGSFSNQMKALQGSAYDAAAAIGTAILPQVTMFVTMARAGVTKVFEWAAANGEMIRTVALVGAALATAGAALIGVGVALKVAAVAAGAVAAGIGVVTSVVAAILSPIGLAVVAVGGLTAAFFTMTDTGRQLAASISETFGGMFKTVSESVSAMASLLAAGEIEAAGKVLWASLDLLWAQGTVALQAVWQSFLGGITKAWDAAWSGMMLGVNSVWGSLERGWSHIGETIGNVFDRAVGSAQVALNELFAYMERLWAEIKGFFGADLQGEINRINRELNASNEILRGQTQGKIDARSASAEAARQRSRQTDAGAAAVIGGDLNAADSATDARANAATSAAQKQLDAAKAAWTDARLAADAVKVAADGQIAKEMERFQPVIDAAGAVASESSGHKAMATLDASFAAQQFGRAGKSEEVTVLERVEQAVKETTKAIDRWEPGIRGSRG